MIVQVLKHLELYTQNETHTSVYTTEWGPRVTHLNGAINDLFNSEHKMFVIRMKNKRMFFICLFIFMH